MCSRSVSVWQRVMRIYRLHKWETYGAMLQVMSEVFSSRRAVLVRPKIWCVGARLIYTHKCSGWWRKIIVTPSSASFFMPVGDGELMRFLPDRLYSTVQHSVLPTKDNGRSWYPTMCFFRFLTIAMIWRVKPVLDDILGFTITYCTSYIFAKF